MIEDITAIDGVERADVVKSARPGGPPAIRVGCTKDAEPLLSQLATALADRGARPSLGHDRRGQPSKTRSST